MGDGCMSNFDELWSGFNEKLFRYIESQVKNPYDAEDILQDVFVKIFRGIGQLENQEAIKPWIYRVTKNTIIDFYKKKKDVSVAPEVLYLVEEETGDADNMNEDIYKCIESMLFQIPDKYQAVYEMHKKKEMKHREIAEELDISVSASKVRLKRAKDMFREKLLECCDFEVDNYGNIIDYEEKGKCCKCSERC